MGKERARRQRSDVVALDFETADGGRDAPCCVAIVEVSNGKIVHRERRLIRPPRPIAPLQASIHGITSSMVEDQPTFEQTWSTIGPILSRARYLVAHFAAFERSVLRACCARARVAMPSTPIICTMLLARRAWGLRPTTLPDVCRYLGLSLNHHDALSDAEAAARIFLTAGDRVVERLSTQVQR